MSEPRYPKGWDRTRVERLIAEHELLSEDEEVAEDEAAVTEQEGQSVITVPDALLPAIRQLLATYSHS